MRDMDAFEQAYKNGYAAGMRDAEAKIVRCKDCKWGEIDDADFPYQRFCSYDGCAWNNENHFCSLGERREDG